MVLNTSALRLLTAESRMIPTCPILAGQGILFKTTECNSFHNYFERIENLTRLGSKPGQQLLQLNTELHIPIHFSCSLMLISTGH